MEKYLNQTKGFLGVIQAILSKDELEKSTQSAEDMYQEIRKIVERDNMSIRETLHAVLAVSATVLSLTLDQMEDKREKGENE